MGIINRGGSLYAEFYNASRTPKAKRYTLRTANKTTARRRYVEWERAWEAGEFDPWTQNPWTYKREREEAARRDAERPHTFAAARKAFIEEKRLLGKTANTLRNYGEVLSIAERFIGASTPLSELRTSSLEPLYRDPSVSDATRHKRFGHVRVFVRWLLREGHIAEDPLKGVEPPRKPHKLPKAVTAEELEQITSAIQEDYRVKRARGQVQEGEVIWRLPLFEFALCTGMRASELARLRWEDVDAEKRLIYIRVQKNHKEQTIPLNTRAAAVLATVERGAPENYVFAPPGAAGKARTVRPFVERAGKAFREGRKLAKIKRRISLHGLRHGFCSRLAEAGKPLYVIKEAARHADLSTSLIYVHMANEHLKGELDDVFD